MKERFDVVVVGAGPAGASVARLLALRGWSVLLVGRASTEGERVGETLGARARPLLQRAELWADFLAQGHCPSYAQRSAWGAAEPLERSAILNPHGTSFHLDRSAFESWLLTHAHAAGVEQRLETTLDDLKREPADDCWQIDLRAGGARTSVRARVVIDATGHSASVARRVGARRYWLDRLVAVAGWYQAAELEPVTLVEAVEHGWWYSAPLPRGRLVAVLTTDAEALGPRSARTSFWQRSLQAAPLTMRRLTGATSPSTLRLRACGPAASDWRVSPSFVPVGDAAAAFDALSGDGLCFALESAARAAEALALTHHGDPRALEHYRAFVRSSIETHLQARKAYYALEQRWPASGFWCRRSPHASPSAGVSPASPPRPRTSSGPSRS